MDFWEFTLELYPEPGVAAACIALQDEHGADVNLLLFALWAASRGARLTSDDIRRVEAAVYDWRTGVVQPLRAARRALKPFADAQALRENVKAAELEAERQQQARMAPLLPAANAARSPALARGNLAACGVAPPDVLLAAWERVATAPTRTAPASPE